jgi:hypothetical protein
MIDMNSIMESIARHRKALAEAWTVNREVVFSALTTARITRIEVTFDGEGDSGQINEINSYSGEEPLALPSQDIVIRTVDWNSDAAKEVQMPLEAAIEQLCYDFLEQKHGGWENNDGAYGEFVFDVTERTVELAFHGRYMDVNTTSHTF